MLSRTDWHIPPTFRRTFASLSPCQAVDIDPQAKAELQKRLEFSEAPLCERQISRLLPSVDSLNVLRVPCERRKFQVTKKHEPSMISSILTHLHKVLMNLKQLKATSYSSIKFPCC